MEVGACIFLFVTVLRLSPSSGRWKRLFLVLTQCLVNNPMLHIPSLAAFLSFDSFTRIINLFYVVLSRHKTISFVFYERLLEVSRYISTISKKISPSNMATRHFVLCLLLVHVVTYRVFPNDHHKAWSRVQDVSPGVLLAYCTAPRSWGHR